MKIIDAVSNLLANLRTLTATRIPSPIPKSAHGSSTLTGQQLLAWMLERWLKSPGVELPDGRRCVLTDNDREFLRRMLLVTLATGHRPPVQAPAQPGASSMTGPGGDASTSR